MIGSRLLATVLKIGPALLIGFAPALIGISYAAAPRDTVASANVKQAALMTAASHTASPPTAPATAATASFTRDEPSDSAPAGSPPLRAAADGVTAIAGRVLQTDGAPLRDVVVKIGPINTKTDDHGLFLLEGIAPGTAVMVIDGRHAVVRGAAEATDHGTYEVRVEAAAARTTTLSWVSWLPRIDHDYDVTLSVPTKEDVVARTPAVPGLELRLPKGAVLTDLDGKPVTHVGLTPIPVKRPPFPLPRNVSVPIYFTAQPGGAVISGANGQWLGAQVVYPNYGHELPKARGTFWRYQPDGPGWSPYGMGTVQADGRQVVPDRDTRIYALSGAMYNGAGDNAPQYAPKSVANAPATADPVDVASGLFVERRTDLALGGLLPVKITRTYRPGDYNRRSFGIGMTLSYWMAFHSTNQYQVTDLILPDGSLVHYTRIINPADPTDNNFITAHFVTNTPGPFFQSHIDWNGSGWNLTRKDGTLFVFADNAPLQYIQDRFGNRVTLTWSNGINGNLVQVSGPNGRFIHFSYDINGCITQAVDNIGRTVNYAYDSLERLSTVTDADGGVTTYTWDSTNRVTSITDPRGIAYIANTYDANDRVTNQVLADGSAYQLAYTLDANGNVTETDITDPRGYVRKVTFNSDGYALTDKYATGTLQEADWSYTRDPVSNLPLSVTDPLGRTASLVYDALGDVLSITRLAGTPNAVTTSFTYTPVYSQLASITDPLGHVTQLQGGPLDRAGVVVDALGNTWHFTYTAQGTLQTTTDPLGNVSQLGYGLDGDPASITDPLGRVTTFSTDAIGRYLSTTDPLGNRVQQVHDPIDGVRQLIDPNGAIVSAGYTPIGNLASITDARGGQTTFTYDSRNLLATRTDALNAVSTVTQRDGIGNPLAAIDRNGHAISFTYDPLNRPLTVSYADGSTVSWTWDLAGRLTQVQDSSGGTITRTYDDLDRLTSETSSQGTVSYTYDAAGRRLSMQAGGQAQLSYTYNDANRLIGITQGSTSLSFGYDAAGRRISAMLPGGITASYTWDAASQLVGITYANGTTTLGDLTYGYDLAGHVVARGGSLFQSVLPAAVTSATYDLANRLTARTAAGVTATPTWDANGNLVSDGARTYTWDARNRLSAVTGVASFAYDAFNRRQTATRGGTATSFLYDGWDVVQEQQGGTPSADLVIGRGIDQRFARNGMTFLIDALGSTTALASAGAVQTSYGYDPYGVVQVTGSASDNPFTYTGREDDGTGLLHYRHRYYSPIWGRFVSEDPLGLAAGDVNLYRYVANSPLQARDPSGEQAVGAAPALVGLAELLAEAGLMSAETAAAVRNTLSAARAAHTLCELVSSCGAPAIPMPAPATPANAKASPKNPCSSGDVLCNDTPPLPEGIVGNNPRQGSGSRTNTDRPGEDFGKTVDDLTGGNLEPQDNGHLVAPNGVRVRQGSDGPRVDIPANPDSGKPHETIHFPKGTPWPF